LADAARDKAGAGCYSALSTAEESEEEAAALQRNLPDHFADHLVLSAPAGADALRRVTRALLRAAPAAAFASARGRLPLSRCSSTARSRRRARSGRHGWRCLRWCRPRRRRNS
jgi:hypothetical protein